MKTQAKQTNLFFGGSVSKYFTGHKSLYLGDKDFTFADQFVNIHAEIKTISKSGKFEGKKITLNQIREYAANVDLKDNYGRINKSYLFEFHKHLDKPYVITVPIVFAKSKNVMDYLDMKNAKCLYIEKDNQFNRWIAGERYLGVAPRKELLCV